MTKANIRVAALDGLQRLVEAAGVDYVAMVRGQGIDPAVLANPEHRLSFAQVVRLQDAAAEATGDDCIGLHLGLAQSSHSAGILGYALQASSDVRTQTACAARYVSLHQDSTDIALSIDGDTATISYTVHDPDAPVHRHDTEQAAAICINQWRIQTGQRDWVPTSVHFSHPVPRASSVLELQRFFGCPMHFGEPMDALRFPLAFLDTPIRGGDAALHQILTRYADECLARLSQNAGCADRVRKLIADGLGSGLADMHTVARQLLMAPRTLQRKLTAEGRPFSALVDETRRDLARKYLQDDQLSLTDVAFLVGYTDLCAFHRAFQRWFGESPVTYQKRVRASGPAG